MRKEANITHSISNFLFLWISVSLLFAWNYYLYSFLFAIIWSLFLFFIEKTNFITKESTKEIISQVWIAWGIFLLWLIWNLTLDINNFLFWSILFINKFDLIILSFLLLIILVLFYFFWRNFLWIIINEDIAKSRWIKVNLYNLFFIITLAIFIAISIKMFWIMLIWAFLVIPVNTWKILSSSLKNVFIFSLIISLLSVIIWLFGSYFLSTSSWASIILILILFFVLSVLFKKFYK